MPRMRELKLCISEVSLKGCESFGFDLQALYQECIQRGYDHPDFAVGGFKKESDIVDDHSFVISEFDEK
jgi:hypothetical protein